MTRDKGHANGGALSVTRSLFFLARRGTSVGLYLMTASYVVLLFLGFMIISVCTSDSSVCAPGALSDFPQMVEDEPTTVVRSAAAAAADYLAAEVGLSSQTAARFVRAFAQEYALGREGVWKAVQTRESETIKPALEELGKRYNEVLNAYLTPEQVKKAKATGVAVAIPRILPLVETGVADSKIQSAIPLIIKFDTRRRQLLAAFGTQRFTDDSLRSEAFDNLTEQIKALMAATAEDLRPIVGEAPADRWLEDGPWAHSTELARGRHAKESDLLTARFIARSVGLTSEQADAFVSAFTGACYAADRQRIESFIAGTVSWTGAGKESRKELMVFLQRNLTPQQAKKAGECDLFLFRDIVRQVFDAGADEGQIELAAPLLADYVQQVQRLRAQQEGKEISSEECSARTKTLWEKTSKKLEGILGPTTVQKLGLVW